MAVQTVLKDAFVAEGGIGTKVASTDVSVTPTAAEFITAFGPVADNRGKVFISDDNGAGTTVRLVVCDGTSYFYGATLTKAL